MKHEFWLVRLHPGGERHNLVVMSVRARGLSEVAMKSARHLCVRTLVVALGAAALHASDNRQRIDSRWRDRDVAVDGNQSEWPGPLVRSTTRCRYLSRR